jgi:hypothetical protein
MHERLSESDRKGKQETTKDKKIIKKKKLKEGIEACGRRGNWKTLDNK